MTTVKISILYPLDDAINRHQLKSLNMRRNVRVHQLFLVNLSQRKNQARYQKRKQCAYTLFLVYLPYYINKAIIIHVFYCPWHQHCIIWVMDMRQNISSGVSKSLLWRFRIKVKCTSDVILLWDITNKKTKKYSIIVLRNGIHPRHMIFWDQSTYSTMCLLLDTCHRTDHCITVCGKWIFDSNFEVALPLK